MLLMWIAKWRFLQILRSFDLTPPQFMTLAALSMRQEPFTMSDLTNITLNDPPTMTGIVNRLVEMGLAERSRSQTDRRVVLVKVTPAGNERVIRIHQGLLDDGLALYEILSDDELAEIERVFTSVLRQVREFLSAQGGHLDAQLSQLEVFLCDPITYTRGDSSQTG
jgi:DNA-binding MarR family transcriptional regulator